jgi:hypothetical protein
VSSGGTPAPTDTGTQARVLRDAAEAVRDHLPRAAGGAATESGTPLVAPTPNVVITQQHLDAVRTALAVIQRPNVSVGMPTYGETVMALTDLINQGAAALRPKPAVA